MKRWLRWWGLIAFVAVVGAFCIFWLILADSLVRRAFEKTATALVGAEVNVGNAGVSLSPLGVTFNAIEVTDPETPANNRVQIARTSFSLDGMLLFRRKLIIPEVAVEGVRFNVPRKHPGRVTAPPEKKERPDGSASFTFPSLDLPSVKTVLESESLGSPAVIDQARSDIRRSREDWQKLIDELPDKEKLDSYRERLKTIKSASRGNLKDLAKIAPDLRVLKQDLDRDIGKTREAKRSFASDYLKSKEIVDRASLAPFDDVRRIKEKYGLSTTGFQNLSRALFGKKISSWVDTGLLWYGRLNPLFAQRKILSGNKGAVVKPLRAKGVDVRFKEHAPLPDLLVSLVRASIRPSSGTFDGTIRNITPDQDILGSPLTFSFTGAGLQDAERVTVDGTFDHVRPERPDNTLRIRAQGYRANGLLLSPGSDLPVTLQQGMVDLDMIGRIDGTTITARITATVRNVRLEAGGGGSPVVSAVRSSLSRVSHFSIAADISGTKDDYTLNVSSDLDRVLKDAVGSVIGDKAAAFEKELLSAIQSRTGDALKGLEVDFGGLASFGGNLDSIEKQLSDLVRNAAQGSGGKFTLPF